MLAIAVGELIAFFYLMRDVRDSDVMASWMKACAAITCIYILGIDFVFGILFGLMFRKARETGMGIKAGWLTFFSGLLVGNFDWRARLSVSLEMKGVHI